MTDHAIDNLYARAQAVSNEIDEKRERLQAWQGSECHRLLGELERVLQGERRADNRRQT